jgi:hypothetical protein
MIRQNIIFSFIFAISLLTGCVPSFGQKIASSKDNVNLGTVSFKGKSSKLTKEAKATLGTLIKEIQEKPTLQVQVVSSSKDFCDECGARNWKRVTAIMEYFSKLGVSENRLLSANFLNGESNEVNILLIASISDTPPLKIQKLTSFF